ncbi:tetratricopeptide repeat protein [Hyalangium versicolor]|uniref:serine/threonine-protein kinase n=1 Tax=Hyalangium versicolor TaxID=2861190 RepID=UPI001CCE030C|nr:serine/threonine-protein kinase [Hyalangium versicolor]
MEDSKTEPRGPWIEAPPDMPTREARPTASRAQSGASSSAASQPTAEGPDENFDLPRGTRIERYVLLKPLGQGGMGVVYSAYDPDLDRKVALKLLRPDRQTPEGHSARAWMLREAQAMARISHPNVIAVYDVGTFYSQVFVAMEFIQGRTLSTWIRKEQHSWQEILRVFLEAGRGLMAAHGAGLVHRDFKPANVLVGNTGRVCVLDFGLARIAELAEAEEESLAGEDAPREGGEAREPLALELPDGDIVMGTPQYMPPEQYLGQGVDGRADQFSFCASLYWALFRKRPFEPRQVARTAAKTSRASAGAADSWRQLPHSSAAKEPPTDAKIPTWVRRAVMRGLSLNPEDRFPSMDALLEALSQQQRRVQRRGAFAAAGALALASAGVGLYLYQQSRVCAGSDSIVASAWSPETRQKLEAAFTATGKPFAAETALKVVRALDGYAGAWSHMHTEACEATRVRGEQTEELLAMRMVCLDRRRKDLGALTSLLSEADAKVVERAVDAAAALPSLQPCQDIASLAEQPPLPADPTLRASIEKLDGRISEVKALHDAGRYKAGVELARKLEPEVVATSYLPLQAELRYHLGWLLQQSGEAQDSITQLEQSFDTAESGHADRLRLEAVTKLIYVFANNGHPEEAKRWGQVGQAILSRLGGEAPLALDLMGNLGYVALLQGRYQESRDYFEKARVLAVSTLGPEDPKRAKVSHGLGLAALRMADYPRALSLLDESLQQTVAAKGQQHPEVATRHTMLATAYRESGDLEKALEHVQQALEIRRATQGPEHPAVADTLDELGMSFIALKRYDEAVKTFREALEIKRKVLGEDHPDLSYSYDGVGQALLAQGHPAEAIEPLRKALSYADTEPEGLAQTGFALAKALWDSGPSPGPSREEARKARELYVRLEKPKEVAEIDAWLGAHAEAPVPTPAPAVKSRLPKRKSR